MTSGGRVDAVVVAYNSASTLRACLAPLAALEGVDVTVVDNASPDDSLGVIADLPVQVIRAGRNGGFAAGCNLGIAAGANPYVLLLNPDARIGPEALQALVATLDAEPGVGIVGPRILEEGGRQAFSQRHFPGLRSTYAQALFLHRLWPRAAWTDELIRDPAAYDRDGSPDWVSGACMLIRRDALERLGGLDEQFFLYCEDVDLCARIRAAGLDVRYDPTAVVHHVGGASRPREELLALLARNRVRYAHKHGPAWAVPLEAGGVALGHLTHALASLTRPAALRGHLRALVAALRARTAPPSRFEGAV